jgi:hypothetical protein
MTPFTNGIFIGFGATLLLGGLAVMSLLNTGYWENARSLTFAGVDPRIVNSLQLRTVGLISLCAPIALIGGYLLLTGALSQISPTARNLLNGRKWRLRIGNGLLGGALVAGGFSVQGLTWNYYRPDAFYAWLSFVYGIISIILFLVGLLVLAWARPTPSQQKV